VEKVKRVFPFFGSEVKDADPRFLKRLERRGWRPLPLDVPALGIVSRSSLRHSVLEDWLDPETVDRCIRAGEECSSHWYREAREGFTSRGICWPEFDSHAMYWFWTNATIADALTEAFLAGGIEQVLLIRRDEPRAGVYYYPSDIAARYWRSSLRGTIAVEEAALPSPWLQRGRRALRSGARPLFHLLQRVAPPGRGEADRAGTTGELRGKVVLAFNPGEFHRFTPLAKKLLRTLPDGMGGIILSESRRDAEKISRAWEMPVNPFPPLSGRKSGPGERFEEAFLEVRKASPGKPWGKALEHLSYHFQYYCHRRWPLLDSSLETWLSLWRDIDPRAVITSSLEDAESMLPGQAARQVGRTTMSVPHGGVQSKTTGVLSCDYVLQNFPLQRLPYLKAGIPPHRLMECRNGISGSQYAADSDREAPPATSWRLLLLTGPVGFPGNLPLLSMTLQVEALKTLANPPRDLADVVGVKVKTHPKASYADPDLLLLAGLQGETVLPSGSDLHSVIGDFDLVIAVNYAGTAMIHVLLAGKPVLLFYNNPLLGRPGLGTSAELFLGAGPVISKREEIWTAVREFFTNPRKADEIRAQAAEFVRENLDNSAAPDIAEVVGGILSGKAGGAPEG
jgi:hypothetical protein